jgi:putative ABC transport system permease protein
MAAWHRLADGLRAWLRRRRTEQDLDEELRAYLDEAADAGVRAGLTPEAARRAARVALGSPAAVKDNVRDVGWESVLTTAIGDLRFGVRMLRRSPAFSLVAVATLALGIGANTTLFSIVDGVLLRPLPYPAPDELVALSESKPNFATGSISYPNFLDWQKDNRTFAAMAIARSSSFSLTGVGEAERVDAQFISSDFFSLLGVAPAAGRFFAPHEDGIGGPAIALISEGLWRRTFGGAADVAGRTLTLDGQIFTIVGVVPAGFDLQIWSFGPADVYLPIGQWTNPLLRNRMAGLGIHGIGRLRSGVTLAQARADMDGVTRNLARAYPEDDTGIGATLIPLTEAVVGRASLYLWVLLGAVGFVLLIACVNIGNLLLARSTSRAREFAVRASLGAGRSRLVRQLLTESLLLAVVGGGLGLLLAAWGTHGALARLPDTLPRAGSIHIDGRVLGFTLAISVAAGLLFGLLPALRAARPAVHDTLNTGGRGSIAGRTPVQRTFVVVEVALAFVLLTGAGLMLRTLGALWRIDPGFDMAHVLTFGVSLSPSLRTAPPDAVRTALREVGAAVRAVPGVQAFSFSWGASPMNGDDEDLFWLASEPRPATQHDMKWTLSYVVGPDYLKAMGIPLIRGRFFTRQDDEHAPHVAVVDEVFARQYFRDRDPIGQRVVLENKGGPAAIVGVVGHVKQWGLDRDDTQELRAQLYFPIVQLPDDAMMLTWSGTGGLVRLDPAAPAAAASIRAAVHHLDPEDDLYSPQSMTAIVADTLAARRFAMALLGAFAVLAILLASIGLYGVMGYGVSERTPEIGLRMALGATRGRVLASVLGGGLRMTLAGVAAGLVAAAGLTRLMGTLLYGVRATDPATFAAVALLLVLVALLACVFPAHRATRIDPTIALRS